MKKLVVMVLVLSAVSFGLVIENPNFDVDYRGDGEWWGTTTGWNGGDIQNLNAGALLSPEAQSGDNTVGLNEGGWLCSGSVKDDLGNAILVETGKTYQVSAWVGRRGDSCGNYAGILRASLSCPTIENSAGALSKITAAFYDLEGNLDKGEWEKVSLTLTITDATYAGEALLLAFDNTGTRAKDANNGSNWWEGQIVLDSVTITPEPATMLLLGLGGLLLRKKR
jgi:hypothetical protein